MADKIFWFDKEECLLKICRLFIYVDIYDLCASTPNSHAERLYEETKKFLEDHCKSMKKVV
jgi:hypothetical protein